MNTSLLACIGSLALALSAIAQNPTPALEASPPTPPPAPADATSPAIPNPPAATDDDEDLERSIERKVRRGLNGINITFGDEKDKKRAERRARREGAADGQIDENVERAIERRLERGFDEGALMAIPIVGIIFATLFGAPVLIVGLIMFFSFWKARSLHKTVRLMVEKGQPVPESLFAAPQRTVRQRSDLRRGIILVMVGIGVMILFGALDDWDGGAWALGIIPFLIGATYLLFWRLDGNNFTFNRTASDHASTDTPPPLP